MLLLILVGLCTWLFYYALIKPNRYWKSQNVAYEKPVLLFGNLASVIFQQQSMAEKLQDIYNNHPNKRCVGLYQFLTPSLILRDPELIKEITVKQFDSFPEHNMFTSEETDPLWSNTLFAMPGGEKWRDLRAVMSPAYTGSKLRTMFELMKQCAQQFTNYFVDEGDVLTVDIMDAFTKATNDIIASTAFGVTCNSLKDPRNAVFEMGKDASNFTGLIPSLKFFVAAISPVLVKFLKIRFIGAKASDFFRTIIKETVNYREENGIVRPDLIHLLMEAKKGKLRHDELLQPGEGSVSESNAGKINKSCKVEITHDVMTAQAINFFLAGFETVARAMSFTAYELAINNTIQQKLHTEIKETLDKCNGEITYEALMGMKYLDMVISEVLRKWPPFAVTDRKPIRDFIIEPKHPDEQPVFLNSSIVCQIPIYSLHRDPQYFPNPETFDPDRFNDENKHNIRPFTYLPFGSGPRNCIGSRFALLEVKTVIFHLLSNFEIIPVEKTEIPLVLGKANVNPFPAEGPWLGLKPKNSSFLNFL